MYDFIPLKAVLNYLPAKLIEEQSNTLQIESWALQALRSINFEQKYQKKICILEIKDHKAELPNGIKQINLVTYLYKQPSSSDIVSLSYCTKQEYDIKCTDNDICTLPIYHSLWINSDYYKNNYQPLNYKGIGERNLCIRYGDYSCDYGFSIDINNLIWTDFKDGIICIDYLSELQNETGEFIVPNDVDLLRGCAEYVMYQHWLNRSMVHEETAFRKSSEHLHRAERLLTKAKSKFLLKNIKLENIKIIQYVPNSLVKVPSAYNNRHDRH